MWAVGAQPAFVGRAREMASLRDAWSLASRGARQLVVIAGEAGIGKSRVVAETAIMLSEREGAVVLHGGCVSAMGALYQPFVQPVASLAAAIESGQLSARDGDLGADVPELLRVISGAEPFGRHRDPELQFTRALFRACLDAVQAATLGRTVLLILEDLHWAGDTALQLLLYLVEHTPDARLLILATTHNTRRAQSAELVATMARLYRVDGVHRLDLDGLTTEAIAEYLMRQAGVAERRTRGPAAVLRDLTGGNPFLLREVWRDLVQHGGLRMLDERTPRTPESLLDSVAHRLDGLPPAHRRTIEIAAVIGEEFALALVTGVVERDHAGAEPGMRTYAGIEAGSAIGLVEPLVGTDGVFRFPHGLARLAVLDLMSEYQRAADNAAVASVLETRFPAADRWAQRLAHHYSCAQALGFADKAVQYLSAAAQVAEAGLAHQDAGLLFERAASLARLPEDRDALRLLAARSHLRASQFRTARRLNEQVCASASGVTRLRAAIGFEAASWRSGEPGERSVELLTAALADVQFDDADPLCLWALAALGRARGFAGDPTTSMELGNRAVELARAIGDPRMLAITLQIGLQTTVPPARLVDKLSRATELTALSERIPDLRHLGPAAYHRAAISYTRGDRAELAAARDDISRTARVTGQPFWEWQANCITFAMQFLHADFAAAMASIQRGGELAQRFEPGQAPEGPMGLQSFMVRRESGQLGIAHSLIRGDEDPRAHWLPGLLALYHELGLREPTRRALDLMLQDGLARYQASASWPAVLSFLCDGATWLGDTAAAAVLHPMLVEYSELNLMGGEFLAMIGSADRYLGAVESLLDMATADRRFDTAERMDGRMGSPVHLATTLAARVSHLCHRGRAAEAAEPAARARTLSRRHGLVRVELLLDRTQPAPDLSRPADRLSTREVEVLRLLGHG